MVYNNRSLPRAVRLCKATALSTKLSYVIYVKLADIFEVYVNWTSQSEYRQLDVICPGLYVFFLYIGYVFRAMCFPPNEMFAPVVIGNKK